MMRQTAFGQELKDLDIRFDFTNRPRLVTGLLAAAHETQDEQAFWSWTISKRLQGLLEWMARSSSQALVVSRACRFCGGMMELHFEAEELIALIEAHQEQAITITYKEHELVMVRPSGRHQQAWQAAVYTSARDAGVAMLQSLSEKPLPKALLDDQDGLATVEAHLAQVDPLIAYEVSTSCPACGQEQRWTIDWEKFCLHQLHRRQQSMLHTVARLAGYYHWSEQDIMAMPSWRRQYYAALI